jgi:glycerol-3-phosphate acyltransferase PlsY
MTYGQAALVVFAYLLGSLPWGYWIARRAGLDIRTVGSGNTGAANVWRALGPRYGVPVFVLDFAKGFIPSLIGLHLYGPGTAVVAGSAAFIGHAFPVFLGFGGGKGVATAAGVVLAITPLLTLACVPVYVAVLWLFRYPSLASMAVAVAYAVLCLVTGQPWQITTFALVGGAAILVNHRTNIRRLLAGTENKAKTFGRGAPRRSRQAV